MVKHNVLACVSEWKADILGCFLCNTTKSIEEIQFMNFMVAITKLP